MKAGKGNSQTQQFGTADQFFGNQPPEQSPWYLQQQGQSSGGMGGSWDSPQMQQWLQSMPSDLMPWFMQMFGGMGGGWPNNQMSGWQQGMGGGMGGGMMPPGAGMMPQMNPLQARRRANAAAAGGGGGGWSRTTGSGAHTTHRGQRGTWEYDETNDPMVTGRFTPNQLNNVWNEFDLAPDAASRRAVLTKWGLGPQESDPAVISKLKGEYDAAVAARAANPADKQLNRDMLHAANAYHNAAEGPLRTSEHSYNVTGGQMDMRGRGGEHFGENRVKMVNSHFVPDPVVPRPEKTREEYDAEQLELQEAAQAKYNAPEDPNDALIRMAAYRDMLGGGYYGGVIPPSLTNPQFASTNPWTELAKLGFRTPEGMQYKWGQNPNIAYGKSPWGQSATSRGGPWMQGPDRGDIQSGGYRQGVLWPGIWG